MKKGRLSRKKILAAAVQVMDRDGLKTLSMRRLGVELGVEAMSLYRYVANKSALLDGIFETILGELKAPVGSGDWRTDVRHTARQFRAVLEAHPNAVLLFATRPAVTPASLDFVEASLAILIDAGFSPHNAMTAF
ncbi:MAG: TetR/AcrR family transcriptional regulator C-terminal domain-containing protein, partial [Myxococcota bacterium]